MTGPPGAVDGALGARAPGLMRSDLYAEQHALEGTHFWHRTKRRLVTDALRRAAPPPARVLEVGCGTGRLVGELRRAGWDAHGCDLAPEALALARAAGLEHVFAHDALRPLDPARGAFDAVLALDLLEHLADEAAALAAWRAALRPGGALVLHVPAHPALYGYWDEIAGHARRYERARLRRALARAGFAVERLTATFAALLGPAALVRTLRRGTDAASGRSDFELTGGLTGLVGGALGRLEAAWLRRADLPLGLSWLAVARRGA